MRSPSHCHVRLARLGAGSRQLLTGLARLARGGAIRLTQQVVEAPPPRKDGPLHLRDKASWDVDLIVDDRYWARIDVHVGTEIDAAAYRGCDLYFKRYIDRRQVSAPLSKLRPYTLCYDVVERGFDRYEAGRIAIQSLSLAERSRQLTHYVAQCMAGLAGIGGRLSVEDLRAPPAPMRDPATLFMTRLWDPSLYEHYCLSDSAELHAMNEMRAACIRELRRELGPRFEGGVQRTAFAEREYGDIVFTTDTESRRRAFIEQVRTHPICVTTAGPHRSNGFKFAEYVAMSRCIVAEPVATEIPGRFAEPRNYLTFKSPTACVQRVLQLVDDPALRAVQMHANWNYYKAWMEPERLAHKLVDAVAARAPWVEEAADSPGLVAAIGV